MLQRPRRAAGEMMSEDEGVVSGSPVEDASGNEPGKAPGPAPPQSKTLLAIKSLAADSLAYARGVPRTLKANWAKVMLTIAAAFFIWSVMAYAVVASDNQMVGSPATGKLLKVENIGPGWVVEKAPGADTVVTRRDAASVAVSLVRNAGTSGSDHPMMVRINILTYQSFDAARLDFNAWLSDVKADVSQYSNWTESTIGMNLRAWVADVSPNSTGTDGIVAMFQYKNAVCFLKLTGPQVVNGHVNYDKGTALELCRLQALRL